MGPSRAARALALSSCRFGQRFASRSGARLQNRPANVTPTERGAHAAVHGHPYRRRSIARGRGGRAREGPGDATEARGAVPEVLARSEGGKDLLPRGRAERRGGGGGPPRRAWTRGGRDLPGGGARVVSPAHRCDVWWVSAKCDLPRGPRGKSNWSRQPAPHRFEYPAFA